MPVRVCVHFRVFLALSIANHRCLFLHCPYSVGRDGVKDDVDKHDDGYGCVDVYGLDISVLLHPAALAAEIRQICFGQKLPRVDGKDEKGEQNGKAKSIQRVKHESDGDAAPAPTDAAPARTNKNLIKHDVGSWSPSFT
jgi:hypothetical protein